MNEHKKLWLKAAAIRAVKTVAQTAVATIGSAAVKGYAETLLPGTGGVGLYRTFVHMDVWARKSRWEG